MDLKVNLNILGNYICLVSEKSTLKEVDNYFLKEKTLLLNNERLYD